MMANDYPEFLTVTLNGPKIGTIDENYIRHENERRRKYFMDQEQWNEININMSKFYGDTLYSSMDIKRKLNKIIEDPCITFTDGSYTFLPGDNSFLVTLRGYKSCDSLFPNSLLNDMPNGFRSSPLKIKNVIFNNPATIVFWDDGTKTVVKCENEEFDKEKGLAMAFMKKMLGNKGRYFNEVKKWTRQDAVTQPDT